MPKGRWRTPISKAEFFSDCLILSTPTPPPPPPPEPLVLIEVYDGTAEVTASTYGVGVPDCYIIDHDVLETGDNTRLPFIPAALIARYKELYDGRHPLADYPNPSTSDPPGS